MSSPHTHINIYNVETAVIFSSCAVRSHVARPKHRFSAMSAVVRTGPDLQYIQYNTVQYLMLPAHHDWTLISWSRVLKVTGETYRLNTTLPTQAIVSLPNLFTLPLISQDTYHTKDQLFLTAAGIRHGWLLSKHE